MLFRSQSRRLRLAGEFFCSSGQSSDFISNERSIIFYFFISRWFDITDDSKKHQNVKHSLRSTIVLGCHFFLFGLITTQHIKNQFNILCLDVLVVVHAQTHLSVYLRIRSVDWSNKVRYCLFLIQKFFNLENIVPVNGIQTEIKYNNDRISMDCESQH